MSARIAFVTAAVALVLAGCSAQLRIPGISLGGGQREESQAQAQPAKPADPEEAKRAEAERTKREAEERAKADEATRKAEQAKELAKKPQQLVIPELAIRITVPGDVAFKARDVSAYGSPDYILEGGASYFTLIVTDATSDRYGLAERLTKQMAEYRYGMDVIRKDQKPGGSWDFEYSYPLYFQDGTSAGTEMGYFSRKVVGGKKYNCLLSGLGSQKALDAVISACDSIAPAKAVAAK
jgi:hypothetical protein